MEPPSIAEPIVHTDTVHTPTPDRSRANQAVSADGRVARRQRNRERVVNAYVRLMQEGVVPTADELADRAEVTARTVYRYIREDSGLKTDVAERVVSEFLSAPARVDIESASLSERIDRFIEFRLDAYERTPSILGVARGRQTHDPVVSSAIGAARGIISDEISRCFATELDRLEPDERRATMVSLQIAVLFESLEHAFEQMEHWRGDVHIMLSRHFETLLAVLDIRPDAAKPNCGDPCSALMRETAVSSGVETSEVRRA